MSDRKSNGEIRIGERVNDFLDADRHRAKFFDYKIEGKQLTLAEAYLKGRLNLRFIHGGTQSAPVRSAGELQVLSNQGIPSRPEDSGTSKFDVGRKSGVRKNFLNVLSRNIGNISDGKDQLVLVCYVERVNPIEQLIPARIWLERIYHVDDLFAGDLYLSIRDGAFKGFRSSAEGELNSLGALCFVASHCENQKIKRGPQVMDRVSDNQSEAIWDGFIAYDFEGSLCSLWVNANNDFERAARQKGVDLPVQIIDVVLGPFNLESGSAK